MALLFGACRVTNTKFSTSLTTCIDAAGYMGFVFFSTVLPGPAIWQTPPEVFKEVFYESVGEREPAQPLTMLLVSSSY